MKAKKITVKVQPETSDDAANVAPHAVHDGYFTAEYSDPEKGKSLLRFALRKKKKLLNTLVLDTLELCPTTLFDNSNKKSHTDIIFTCQTIYGKNVLVFFILEHKSYYDTHISIQVGNYFYKLLDKLWNSEEFKGKKLPFVIPIVILQGNRAKYIPLTELFDKRLLGISRLQDLDVVTLHLSEIPEEVIRNGWPKTFPLRILKEYQNPKIFSIISDGIIDIQKNHNSNHEFDLLITRAMAYIAAIKRCKIQDIQNYIAKQPGGDIMNFDTLVEEKVGEYFMDKAREEGRVEGREEGRVEGREEGRVEGRVEGILETLRKSVQQILSQRFGTIPKSLYGRICHIEGSDTLNMLMLEAVKCNNLAAFKNTVNATLH